MRVLIADDSTVTRLGIRTALEKGGLEICGEAADAQAAIDLAVSEHPDLCLLDVTMPEGGGIRAAREISRRLPGTPIVMLSASRAGEDVIGAMREGASGYVLKDAPLERLAEALRAAASGDAPLSKRVVRDIMEENRARDRFAAVAGGRGGDVSEREWDVLELLAADHSVHEIALRLGVSEATVQGDVSSAVRKLDVPDRAAAIELLRRARAAG